MIPFLSNYRGLVNHSSSSSSSSTTTTTTTTALATNETTVFGCFVPNTTTHVEFYIIRVNLFLLLSGSGSMDSRE
jgi:hypothetical protein